MTSLLLELLHRKVRARRDEERILRFEVAPHLFAQLELEARPGEGILWRTGPEELSLDGVPVVPRRDRAGWELVTSNEGTDR